MAAALASCMKSRRGEFGKSMVQPSWRVPTEAFDLESEAET